MPSRPASVKIFRLWSGHAGISSPIPASSHASSPRPTIMTGRGGPPDMVLLHYTGDAESREAACARLCDVDAAVSSHYLVYEDGHIDQLVQEERRAWHAGKSFWAGETDLNSRSIGIEIVNPGHDFGYPEFPEAQIAAVIALCRGIIARRPIPRDRVLAHSDVAPSRKQDPGEKFPWRLLADSGVGLWVEPAPINDWRYARSRRQRRQGPRPATGAGRVRLWHRRHRPIRRRHQDRRHRLPAPFPAGPGRWIVRSSTRETPAQARCRAQRAVSRPTAHEAPNPPSLTAGRQRPPCLLRSVGGRPLRQRPKGRRGGKSGLHGHTVPDNVRRGQPQGQCHREQTAAARSV